MTPEDYARINNSFKVSMTVMDMVSVALKWSKRIVREAINAAVADPRIRSCAAMACGLCFTFIGYEYARAASITLLASKEADLGSEALPLTVVVGSPLSGLVLYMYTKSIKRSGSRLTLRRSYILVFLAFLYMILACNPRESISWKMQVVCFYAFREVYVSLLSTQQWAFISTTLDKSTSNYIVSFSGVVSVASAVGGVTVERLVNLGGMYGLLVCAFIAVVLSFVCAEYAAATIADYHAKRAPRKDQTCSAADASNNGGKKPSSKQTPSAPHGQGGKPGFFHESWALVRSHKILQLLFVEGVVHQLCTTMLNIMFHNGLRASPLANDTKARMVGRFFATINVTACALQVFVLPTVLSPSSLPAVLCHMPLLVLGALGVALLWPGLVTVMLAFGSMKALEYSVMNAASEMIFVPLGSELRYVGKELIKYFGHKLGRSGSSLVLSGLLASFQPSLQAQALWATGLAAVWAAALRVLSGHLAEREGFAGRTAGPGPERRLVASTSVALFDLPAADGDDRDATGSSAWASREEATLVSVSSKNILFDPDGDEGGEALAPLRAGLLRDGHGTWAAGHEVEAELAELLSPMDCAPCLEDDLTTSESYSPSGFLSSRERSRDNSHTDPVHGGDERVQASRSSTNLHRQSACFSKVPFSNAFEEIVVLQPEPMASPDLRQRVRKAVSEDKVLR